MRELNFENAHVFRAAVEAELSSDLQAIELDLSQMEAVDGTGLGALASLYEMANERGDQNGVVIRLKSLPPPVLQMIELARLHHFFEIETPYAGAVSQATTPHK